MSELKRIAILSGDGIGPEVIDQAIKVLKGIEERYSHNFEFRFGLVGGAAIEKLGNPLPDETIELCKDSDAILMGAIGDPKYDRLPSNKRPEAGLLKLRKTLKLFANIRPVRSYEKLYSLSPLKTDRIKDVDFIIYRELTGGIYFGDKGRKEDGSYAFDVCEYHKSEIQRIAHLAFQAAQKRKKKVTLVDKANVLETSRLWRDTVDELSFQYLDVELEHIYIDNAAMQIIINPRRFDIILCDNMFGDILSDEASVIAGSLGLLPSGSLGEKYSLFEPVHGSYPEAAGKDLANPLATILSVAMMMDHFNMHTERRAIHNAIKYCMTKSILTEDLDPDVSYSCSQLGDVIQALILDEEGFNIKGLKEGSSLII